MCWIISLNLWGTCLIWDLCYKVPGHWRRINDSNFIHKLPCSNELGQYSNVLIASFQEPWNINWYTVETCLHCVYFTVWVNCSLWDIAKLFHVILLDLIIIMIMESLCPCVEHCIHMHAEIRLIDVTICVTLLLKQLSDLYSSQKWCDLWELAHSD